MTDSRDDVLTDRVHDVACPKCGKVLDVSQIEPFAQFKCGVCGDIQTVPARLGAFLLIRLLGRGGMGAVYQGVDQSLGRNVAVKVMLRSFSDDKESFAQFRREAQAAAALNSINIVQIYSFGESHGQPYIVMELLAGGRLDQMIGSGTKLDEAMVLKVGIDVAQGLDAANSIGLMHGDIKPENILMDANKVAKVVDFGLARFRDREAGVDGVWGTPYYIAPEKIRKQRVDLRSDIYSLGATLFHALAGRPPFEGTTPLDVVKARLEQPAPDLMTLRPDINPRVAAIIARMLEMEPTKRYPTYASLLADLHATYDSMAKKDIIAGRKPGGRIVITKGKMTAPGAAGPATTTVPATGVAKPGRARKAFKWIAIVLVILLALGGVVTACLFLWAAKKHAAGARAEQQALERVRGEATAAYVAFQSNATGTLARTARICFADDEATNILAKVRRIVNAMGANTNLVTMPDIPEDAAVFVQVEAEAAKSLAAVTNLEDIAREAATTFESAGTAATSGEAAVLVAALRELTTKVVAPVSAASTSCTAVEKLIADMNQLVERVTQAKADGEKRAVEVAAQHAEADQQAAAAAAAQRVEEARKAAIAAEIAKVDAAWQSNMGTIKENAFAEAGIAIAKDLRGLQTDDGKKAAVVLQERCKLLQGLKEHLIGAIKAEPYQWGWISASGSGVDILTADDKQITIRSGTVPWTQVSVRQMIKLIGKYVPAAPGGKLKRSELSRMNLAAAVFCYVHGGQKQASEYAARAVALDESLAAEVKLLMPERAEDGAGAAAEAPAAK